MKLTKSDLRRLILEVAHSSSSVTKISNPNKKTVPQAIPGGLSEPQQKTPSWDADQTDHWLAMLAHAIIQGVKEGNQEQIQNAAKLAQKALEKFPELMHENMISLDEFLGLGKKKPEQKEYDAVYRQWEVAVDKARKTNDRTWEQRANQLRQKLYQLDAASPNAVKKE